MDDLGGHNSALLDHIRQEADAIVPPEAPAPTKVMRRGRARRGLRVASATVVAVAVTTAFVWTGAQLAGLHHNPSVGAGPGASRNLAVRIVLPATTMPAGTSMDIKLIVDNETGHTVTVTSCGSPFAVALANERYTPSVYWTLCAEPFSIPPGKSTYADILKSSYLACGDGGKGFPRCLQNGNVPPLPPGIYFATLYTSVKHLVHAVPVRVRVTPVTLP